MTLKSAGRFRVNLGCWGSSHKLLQSAFPPSHGGCRPQLLPVLVFYLQKCINTCQARHRLLEASQRHCKRVFYSCFAGAATGAESLCHSVPQPVHGRARAGRVPALLDPALISHLASYGAMSRSDAHSQTRPFAVLSLLLPRLKHSDRTALPPHWPQEPAGFLLPVLVLSRSFPGAGQQKDDPPLTSAW